MTSSTLATLKDAVDAIHQQLAGIVVGQVDVVDQLMVAILARQHCLLEAAPGSAKNLLATSLAETLGLSLYRVHCSRDLSPAELMSRAALVANEQTAVQHEQSDAAKANGSGAPELAALPHVLLVDDISRLRPATRVVLQQAMQDGMVDLDGQRAVVPTPFIVLTTKYRQDEEPADVGDEPRDDRYMLKIAVPFPSYQDEFQVSDAPPGGEQPGIKKIVDAAQVVQFQQAARAVVAPTHVIHYALRLVRSTRVHQGHTPDFAYEWIGIGAGPRASHHLLAAAKMKAALDGREFAGSGDVQAMIHSVLRHRLVANQHARANGITPDRIIDRLVYEIPVRIDGDDVPAVEGEAPKFDVTSDDHWMAE